MKQVSSGIFIRLAAVALLPAGLLSQGCNTNGCTDNHSALPLMGFYDYATGQSISLDSIDFGGVGAPGDSLLIHSGQRKSQVYLPFRQATSSTSFFFHYDYKEQGLDDPAIDDIVTFHYDAEPYFASSECGAMYRYVIRDVEYTRHLIDSIAVIDPVITNVEMERIQVFFRTVTPEEPDDEENPGDEETPGGDNPDENPGTGGDEADGDATPEEGDEV